MCTIGVRQAFSHAHRPQGNGKAEVAGRSIITLLRKLRVGEGANWVEALPRVLRLQHDMVGETGLSPYEIVFGRERNLPGIPFRNPRWSEEASAYLERMRLMDEHISAALNAKHSRVQDQVNAARKRKREYFKVHAVWVVRPKSVDGCKVSAWWLSPARVCSRSGQSSYQSEFQTGDFLDVHRDQLKPCYDPPLPSNGIPLFSSPASSRHYAVPRIVRISAHRCGPTGDAQFLAHWEGTSNAWTHGRAPLAACHWGYMHC